MDGICGDNRFEIIAKAKEHLLDATNIDTSPKEMEVLDDFLFRCWQMGWLERYNHECEDCLHFGDKQVCGRCRYYSTYADRKTEPTHDLRTETHECVKDTHDKTESNSEKPNNYEPKTCDNCKLKGSTKWCDNQVVCRAYQPKDEPQTERSE